MKSLNGFFFIIACIVVSCTSRAVEPTRQSRHSIDTLFQKQVSILQPEMDSLCKSQSGQIYANAVDSIMAARKVEMNILVE